MECITKIYKNMSYKYFPIEFSSYEDYVKYLKEKGFAIEVTEDNNSYKNKDMIKEAYCSFEVAKLLKEKGFNEEVISYYDTQGQGYFISPRECNIGTGSVYAAPTHQMAMAWLREVHNIFIDVHLSFAEDPEAYPAVYYVYILDVKSGNSLLKKAASISELNPLMDISNHNVPINFDSPEKAVEAALKYVLENLI